MRLDAKTVAALKLVGQDKIHFDDNMPGFGYRLRRSPDGKVMRSWIVQYRRAGTSRRMLLGAAAVLGAEQARTMAKKVLARVALGEDPQGDRADRRGKDKHTLRAMVDDYLALKRSKLRKRTFVEVERYLTGGYFRALHGMAIDSVTQRDVALRLVAIIREQSESTAAHARAVLSAFFTWALQMGLCAANPVINTPRAASKQRDRVLSDPEMASIWAACGDDDFGRAVRLLMLTACRRSEIGGLRWSEFDFARGTLTIAKERSKNGRAHTLPLMPLARSIIDSVPRMAHRDQLFGVRADGFTGWAESKRSLDKRCGVTGWTLHDIRRSAATGMADLGLQPHVIEQILNHQSGHRSGVAGIYNRSSYANEVRAALALWEDHIRSITTGEERKVIPLRAE